MKNLASPRWIAALILILSAARAGAAGPSSGAAQPRAQASADGFSWPVPAGWRKETIPFPLEFAPKIPHKGVEELRFGPGFSHPGARDFWSYDFVWRLDDDAPIDEKTLADELAGYFRGLNMSVAGKKYGFDESRFKASVSPVPAPTGATTAEFRARVESYDAFATGKPIVLNVEVRREACPEGRRHFAAFSISPRPEDDPVWKSLREEASAFRCR
ncbi:MAG TPA: hypothetical protein VH309_05190 [Elusimicrobiota bacterium]|jgi:hypothetical protein|nr:hypothetical protein [Elusimicrobiota bacterium]